MPLKIYRFKLFNDWYAYALLKDALSAWAYFYINGHRNMSDIEQSEDNVDFQFKLNSTNYPANWSNHD